MEKERREILACLWNAYIIEEITFFILSFDPLYDTISGMMAAENGQYEGQYDLFSNVYTLSVDMALTKHGQKQIVEDSQLKLLEMGK